MQNLGYSEDQAYRRISAMRLLRELPQIERKIQNGEISLANLSLAQTLFRKQEKFEKQKPTSAGENQLGFSEEQKIEILEKLENKSSREAEKVVMSYSSEPLKMVKEKIRTVSPEVIEVRFAITPEIQRKLEKLKGLVAHSSPDLGLSMLLDKLCDLGIQKWDPALKRGRKEKSMISSLETGEPPSAIGNNEASGEEIFADKAKRNSIVPAAPRVISAKIKRAVWLNAKSQCEQCGSKYALQIDHRVPRAMNGSNDLENLRLLCRSCNQRAAIKSFGVRKMEPYIS